MSRLKSCTCSIESNARLDMPAVSASLVEMHLLSSVTLSLSRCIHLSIASSIATFHNCSHFTRVGSQEARKMQHSGKHCTRDPPCQLPTCCSTRTLEAERRAKVEVWLWALPTSAFAMLDCVAKQSSDASQRDLQETQCVWSHIGH